MLPLPCARHGTPRKLLLSVSHFLTVEWDVVLISYGCYENEMNEWYQTIVHVSKSK